MRSILAVLLTLTAAPLAAAAWHHPLYLSGGGYWSQRVPVTVRNPGATACAGDPVSLALPALAGCRVEELRACSATGQELLFDVREGGQPITWMGLPLIGDLFQSARNRGGAAKRAGRLAATDRISLPVECPAGGTATLYVYAGNPQALAVPDFLTPAGLVNGGFEIGGKDPEGWAASLADAQHRLTYEAKGGRTGGRCVKTEVDPGAPGTWVAWRQMNIRVKPGDTYRMTAWVRAENVAGSAGWFVHVNGDTPQLVNRTLNAGDGTYGWKEVSVTFTVPPTGSNVTIGTLLNGTGRAWFDDIALVGYSAQPELKATAGPVERLALAAPKPAQPRFSREWPYRAVVRVLNLSDRPAPATLVSADLRRVLGRLRRVPANASVRVVDPDTGKAIETCLRLGSDVLFPVSLPARTAREYHVYLSGTLRTDEKSFLAGYALLMQSPLNLAPNPSFERGGARPDGWTCAGEKLTAGFQAGIGSHARLGRRGVRVVVPPRTAQDWVGWRSGEIPAQPGASYLYGGFLKTQGLSGTARLHAHVHDGQGKLVTASAFHSTTPEAGPTSDWVHTAGVIHTAPDAASIQLHLTMNATGTLEHDGILLCRTLPGEAVSLDGVESAGAQAGLRAWSVNPLVKVFPDDLPGPAARGVAVECARNEYEPIQLGLRSPRAIPRMQVAVSPLSDGKGHTLPPLKVEHVGCVPVDHPSGYFRSDLPAWCRMVPRGAGSTDGWAGEWPDPLIPGGRFDLAAGRAQAIWLTAYAPAGAVPGDYRATLAIRAPGIPTQTVPLRVTVLPFTLPKSTRLKAIFDLRSGPGGDFGSGLRSPEGQRKWLRFLAERRLGTDHIPAQPVFSYKDGKVTMDAAAFDEMARYCFDELGMNVSYTPAFFYAFGWARTPKRFFGLEPFTPEYNDAFRQAYRLFSEHVKARGWHDRFLYYISDEPHFTHPFVVEQMKQMCALAHEADPAMPIYSSTWRHCPEWDESLDVWGVGQYGCFPVEQMRRLQQAGKKMVYTCDGQMATDTPYLATERMLPYYCLKYDVLGFEFWGVSWWTLDPWERGWHTFIRQSSDGKEFYWTRYPNGDGYLTYPGARVGVDGPVSTIRLEQVREGLEDFEALAILSERVAAARRAGKPAAEGEHALAMARNLVTIPNAGGLRSTQILPDPDRIPAIRKAVNAAVVELGR